MPFYNNPITVQYNIRPSTCIHVHCKTNPHNSFYKWSTRNKLCLVIHADKLKRCENKSCKDGTPFAISPISIIKLTSYQPHLCECSVWDRLWLVSDHYNSHHPQVCQCFTDELTATVTQQETTIMYLTYTYCHHRNCSL